MVCGSDPPVVRNSSRSTVLDILDSRKITQKVDTLAEEAVEELETLLADTKPRISHY